MRKLALGIDVGGTNIKAAIVDETGAILQFQKVPTHAGKGFPHTFEIIRELIRKQIDSMDGFQTLCGIGYATAGQVDYRAGKVVFATGNIPGLTGFEIKKELEETFKLPVLVENDVNAAAVGEYWLGAAKGMEDFICLTLGTGVGGAIFRNGEIDHGFGSIAGEFGHMCIKAGGEACNCGNNGCFEKYGSVSALISAFRGRMENGEKTAVNDLVNGDPVKISGEMIFNAADLGDSLAQEVVAEYMEYLAVGVTSLLHILNPGAVIIGGGISQLGERLAGPLRDSVKAKGMPKFTENLIVRCAALGDNAGICGAVKGLFD